MTTSSSTMRIPSDNIDHAIRLNKEGVTHLCNGKHKLAMKSFRTALTIFSTSMRRVSSTGDTTAITMSIGNRDDEGSNSGVQDPCYSVVSIPEVEPNELPDANGDHRGGRNSASSSYLTSFLSGEEPSIKCYNHAFLLLGCNHDVDPHHERKSDALQALLPLNHADDGHHANDAEADGRVAPAPTLALLSHHCAAITFNMALTVQLQGRDLFSSSRLSSLSTRVKQERQKSCQDKAIKLYATTVDLLVIVDDLSQETDFRCNLLIATLFNKACCYHTRLVLDSCERSSAKEKKDQHHNNEDLPLCSQEQEQGHGNSASASPSWERQGPLLGEQGQGGTDVPLHLSHQFYQALMDLRSVMQDTSSRPPNFHEDDVMCLVFQSLALSGLISTYAAASA